MGETAAETRQAPRRSFLLRRILPLAVLLGVAVWYFRDAPRDVTVVIDLSGRSNLAALKVDIVQLPERHVARHVEHFYSAERPAPARQPIAVRISPGDYLAEIVFDHGGKTERTERRFQLDREEEILLPP